MNDNTEESHEEIRDRILAKLRARHTEPPPPGSVAALLVAEISDEQLAETFASLPPDARARIFREFPHIRPE